MVEKEIRKRGRCPAGSGPGAAAAPGAVGVATATDRAWGAGWLRPEAGIALLIALYGLQSGSKRLLVSLEVWPVTCCEAARAKSGQHFDQSVTRQLGERQAGAGGSAPARANLNGGRGLHRPQGLLK